MSLTRRPSTPVMPIPQPTSRHDTINPAHDHVESKPGPTYRDRIFEYHVVAPLLLKAIDKSYPHEIPASKLYRATATYMVDSKDPMVVDYWAHLCDHDKAWFVQNFLVLLGDSNLGGRLVDDDTKYLNVMLDSTPELDQLVPHDEWMEMARHAAVTRWDGSGCYDDLLRSYGLPVNALTMWQVDSFHPDDFDDAWNLLLDDWRLAARDEGIDTGIEGTSKPDWFYRLEAKSRNEDWFLRKAKKQEDEELQEAMESVEEDGGSGDGSWNGGDGMDTSYGSSYDAAYDPSYDGGDWFDGGHEDDDVPGIEPEAPVEEAGVFRGTPDGLEDLDRALAGEIYARSGRKVIPCDHPGEDERPSWDLGNASPSQARLVPRTERPSWDLGNGIIGADA